MNVTRILYRGSLSSCNYACEYCPFAKTTNTREELDRDRLQLNRFVDWVAASRRPVGLMITPWGEAIIHRYYREAMIRLSWMEHVHRVAIQTNLSGRLDDLAESRTDRIACWATFHPGEADMPRFVGRCQTLNEMGIRFSVGMVGYKEHFDAIAELRRRLPADVYLWINVPKSSHPEYNQDDIQFLQSVDPYFRWNAHRWPSLGKPCQTGWSSFTVDGLGNARRCHVVDNVLGNIYQDDVWATLQRRVCPNTDCGCHIGYVHRDEFELDRLYGQNILERIPVRWPEVDTTMTHPPLPSPVSTLENRP